MSAELKRYSFVTGKLARECILIQGKGCIWKKCTYCDYHLDSSDDPFETNQSVINMIKGENGILEVMNSGSAPELDYKTIESLRKKTEETGIHTIWFEAHWMYRHKLKEFSENFPGCKVYFRTGVESFDPEIRMHWNKGIPSNVTPYDISKFFRGVNILVGLKGQSIENIKKDIEIANEYFDYFHVNLFCENSTKEKRDPELINEFMKKLYPVCAKIPKAYVSLDITDFGVG